MNHYKHIGILYIVITLLICALFLKKCNVRKLDPRVIIIPEVIGSFNDSTPESIVEDEEFKRQLRDTVLTYYHPVDIIEIDSFEKANEDIKVQKYIDARGERKYNKVFEDDNIQIEYDAVTLGELKSLSLDYTIKSKTVEITPVQQTVFALYAGGGVSTTTQLDNLNMNVSLGFQNKRGDIITTSIGTDPNFNYKTIQVGYLFNVFSIKK